MYCSSLSFTSRLDVGGWLMPHPGPQTPDWPVTHCIGGQLSPIAGLEGFIKLRYYRDLIPGLFSLQRLAVATALSRIIEIKGRYIISFYFDDPGQHIHVTCVYYKTAKCFNELSRRLSDIIRQYQQKRILNSGEAVYQEINTLTKRVGIISCNGKLFSNSLPLRLCEEQW